MSGEKVTDCQRKYLKSSDTCSMVPERQEKKIYENCFGVCIVDFELNIESLWHTALVIAFAYKFCLQLV